MNVTLILQTSIEIIQQERNELLEGDPAVEGLVNLIIQANQTMEEYQKQL